MYLVVQRLLAGLVKAALASAERFEVGYGLRRFKLIQQADNDAPRVHWHGGLCPERPL